VRGDHERTSIVPESTPARDRLDKLGVRPGFRVSVLRLDDQGFLTELAERGADIARGRRRKGSDVIFLGVEASTDLPALGTLEPYLERNGAVWVVYPKGRQVLKEVDVIQAGLRVGLVDNKVVRFSDTHTALRFVIPKARR
jgi:hypothetical protein